MGTRGRFVRTVLVRLASVVFGAGTFLWFLALAPLTVLAFPPEVAPWAAAVVVLAGLEAGRRITGAATAAIAASVGVPLERAPVTALRVVATAVAAVVAGTLTASAIVFAVDSSIRYGRQQEAAPLAVLGALVGAAAMALSAEPRARSIGEPATGRRRAWVGACLLGAAASCIVTIVATLLLYWAFEEALVLSVTSSALAIGFVSPLGAILGIVVARGHLAASGRAGALDATGAPIAWHLLAYLVGVAAAAALYFLVSIAVGAMTGAAAAVGVRFAAIAPGSFAASAVLGAVPFLGVFAARVVIAVGGSIHGTARPATPSAPAAASVARDRASQARSEDGTEPVPMVVRPSAFPA